jgi:hypothetical protein
VVHTSFFHHVFPQVLETPQYRCNNGADGAENSLLQFGHAPQRCSSLGQCSKETGEYPILPIYKFKYGAPCLLKDPSCPHFSPEETLNRSCICSYSCSFTSYSGDTWRSVSHYLLSYQYLLQCSPRRKKNHTLRRAPNLRHRKCRLYPRPKWTSTKAASCVGLASESCRCCSSFTLQPFLTGKCSSLAVENSPSNAFALL